MDSKSFRHRHPYGKVLIQLVAKRQKELQGWIFEYGGCYGAFWDKVRERPDR